MRTRIAWLNLRHAVPERWDAFARGLRRIGYIVQTGVTLKPHDGDILVTWNRIREGGTAAMAFENQGHNVIVAENASWGNDFLGRRWYTLGWAYHNERGTFLDGGSERWDRLRVELQPWRTRGGRVILPSRGIGAVGHAMPPAWVVNAQRRYGGRVRPHPGQGPCVSLEDDLCGAGDVVTWGSGAAIRALMWGLPVTSEMPNWIGEQDNTDRGRLAMVRALAWAQWELKEIADGEPFMRLLR